MANEKNKKKYNYHFLLIIIANNTNNINKTEVNALFWEKIIKCVGVNF